MDVVNWGLVTVLVEVWLVLLWRVVWTVKGGVLIAWLVELLYHAIRQRAYSIGSIGLTAVSTRVIADALLIIISTYIPLGLGFWGYFYLVGNIAYAGLVLLASHYRLRFDTRKLLDLAYLMALAGWIGIGIYNSVFLLPAY